jgi:hypothetical protein
MEEKEEETDTYARRSTTAAIEKGEGRTGACMQSETF